MPSTTKTETRTKLLAEWFWVDRWMGSNAFLLPIEPRGLYREMLSQAWRREARLPNDHEAIRRAVGCTAAEWRRCWPKIRSNWRVDGESLVNDTQLAVYAEAVAGQLRASQRGKKGAQARAQALAQARAHATEQALEQVQPQVLREVSLKDKPPSPSPVPLPERAPEEGPAAGAERAEARSKRPIFRGNRLTVFEWMLDDIRQMLGPNFEDFSVDEFFDSLDQKLRRDPVVIPKKDGGKWLYARVQEEAERRGLRLAGQQAASDPHPHMWQCGSCGDFHEGTEAQALRGVCLRKASGQ